MPSVLVFGDSIAWGYYDKEGGWVERLKKLFIERMIAEDDFDYPVYNLSISGNDTKDLLERFEFETSQRTKEEKIGVIIFGIGINDSQIINKSKKPLIPKQELQKNIKSLIASSRRFTDNILFIGLNPVDESKVNPVPWRPEISYINEYVEEYNETIKAVCKENKVHFIDFFKEWMNSDYKSLLEDGAHPNSEGHKKIFEIVRDYLTENKIV